MTDITDVATRSRMMSGIRGKNTKPELVVRKALYERGLRYRLHVRSLAGTPDLVFPRYKAVVFVHGCFWHRHNCALFKMPSSRPEFWREKLDRNRERDREHMTKLLQDGWRVAVVWECSLRTAIKSNDESFFNRLADWIKAQELTSIEL
ncbi:very short patch repair endonuclease [Burkholderia diffusa]|uniref:very short patch repair endonuclease n=1 Tax=Burkholderia diffusa TaxID=488732 RepID=UPI0012441D0D|nr:very short patch repair endonuclease [Burkholderia diffusa]KAB0649685.1 DNA mismatch endonuclease Vsr [Burkholderia diffusa]MBM2652900.1 DNA mismatch endonuclease Vsr [Burkholderia diffusa]